MARTLGPYAAIELLLPGGSMLALLYWWHRRRKGHVGFDRLTITNGIASEARNRGSGNRGSRRAIATWGR